MAPPTRAPRGNPPGAAADATKAPIRRIPRDEEVVAAATKVILEEEVVTTQRRLLALVLRELRSREPLAALSGGRLRRLVLQSGLVEVTVHVRVDGPTPRMERCPVCGAPLTRTTNRTLAGGTTRTGYRCPECPWWTGRLLRVPTGYAFHSRLKRVDRVQTRFASSRERLTE